MASKQTCREVAGVPPDRLPQRLSLFFADMACRVFDETRAPNSAPDEACVRDELVTPLQWMLCGRDPAVAFCSLQEHQTQANFCGKVFRGGEPAYFCKDCQTDPTCCFCMECFEHSEHKNHNYRLFASGGGGCCDCGDAEAWTSFVHCDIHKPSEQDEQEVDPVEALPSDLVDRARPFFTALLWYCMKMLCWEEPSALPPSLLQASTAHCLANPSFLSFLYNDEDHSYDEVIYALTAHLKRTHTDAVALATFVDRKGRAVCKAGTLEECQQSKELINTSLANRKPLKVMVFHSAVAAHQTCAILCLSLLKELSEKLDAFRRLISEALIHVSSPSGRCILDYVFLSDHNMWITARLGWHRLVMSSIFMDMKCKPQLAVNLTNNYSQLLKNFVADSHNHDVCASNMTVQLFTVPSLSRMLVKSHGLLEKIVTTLTDLMTPCKSPDTGVLRLTKSTYKHPRVSYVMFDLRLESCDTHCRVT
jgi:E3 ubiquitin-protein ligase UBR2